MVFSLPIDGLVAARLAARRGRRRVTAKAGGVGSATGSHKDGPGAGQHGTQTTRHTDSGVTEGDRP